VEAHGGNKNLKLSWTGENSIITTGWNNTHQREIKFWDIRNNERYLMKTQLDNASGVLHTYYEVDTKVLFLSGRGEGNIKYFEVDDKEGKF